MEPSSLMEDLSSMAVVENLEEANEREIQRILQEELNMQEAQAFEQTANMDDLDRPMTNYERSKLKTAQLKAEYGDCPELWPEGIRPADKSQEQQLIGGDDEMLPPQQPGYTFTNMVQNFSTAFGFTGGPSNTDDMMRVNDNNGIMMPDHQGLPRSNSGTELAAEFSNQN